MGLESQELVLGTGMAVPLLVARGGEGAGKRFLEFFTAQIRNPNTREAYARAVVRFLAWCEAVGVEGLAAIEPLHVASYIERLGGRLAKPSVKQELAALRRLFDYLVVGQVIAVNPAASVRGPTHIVQRGKTPVLSVEEARLLFDAIETETLVGLRDRALIGVLTYAFARVGAVVAMRVADYYPLGKRSRLRLHEKGGKEHEMPAHHTLEAYLDAYLRAAGHGEDKHGWLFRTVIGRTGRLSERGMHRGDVYRMVRRRACQAGILAPIGCHTFRATGITAYLDNGGTLEKAQRMAAHASPRTTKLYDRTSDAITLDEVERIQI